MLNTGGGPLLRLDQVSKAYGSYQALQPTSISVDEGEFFSLLGPSGCGKTTTLRIIAGFEVPSGGTVHLGGHDITRTPPNHRDTNTVFQSYALFPHMTAAENVAYPLKMRKVPASEIPARVTEAISQVEMTKFSERLPHEMSGGQRQRIALARAIVGRPRVLLLDEPLGALDLKLREQMQHVLVHLQRKIGITFVYVTHDQGEALSMSDRIAVMSGGRLQQLASPRDLYYQPANSFVASFIGKSNVISGAIETVSGRTVLRSGALTIPMTDRAAKPKAALRYEAIALGPEAEGRDVVCDAVVEDALFLGNSVEITLDLAGSRLVVMAPSQRDIQVRPGDRVRAGFNVRDLVPLDD
ncbi:PotA ABC-type spermidine/putrescine transport systems, ATPase components [Paracoccaceae bacterium]